MKIADAPATAQVQTCCKKKVVRKRHAAKRPVQRVPRVVTTKRVIRTATPQTQVVTQQLPLPPIPYAHSPRRAGFDGGGGDSGVTVIGAAVGGGFVGGFVVGFFGETSGGGRGARRGVTATTH